MKLTYPSFFAVFRFATVLFFLDVTLRPLFFDVDTVKRSVANTPTSPPFGFFRTKEFEKKPTIRAIEPRRW